MKSDAIILGPKATREIDTLRAEGRGLDEELNRAFDLLSRFPEIGAPRKKRRRFSMEDRKWILGRTPYRVFYRVNREAEVLLIQSVRHYRRRPPRL